ncbi:MAG: hypothetical protein ACYTE6_13340 [Planctomycetota bacterium]|jgi:hypothetical protein
MPFRAIRNQLRLIRYYSATRPYNRWSRALDIALASALALAIPATWGLDSVLIRHATIETGTGKLFQEADGRLWAWAGFPSMPPLAIQGDATFSGTFWVDVTTEDRGWPFITSRRPRPAQLTVDLFAERRALQSADLPVDSPVRLAISVGLGDAGLLDAAAAVRQDPALAPSAFNRPAAWAANALTWALLLAISAWVMVSLLRVVWLPVESAHHARRKQRRRQDRCANCGYDLRASGLSERCPECGTLVY